MKQFQEWEILHYDIPFNTKINQNVIIDITLRNLKTYIDEMEKLLEISDF